MNPLPSKNDHGEFFKYLSHDQKFYSLLWWEVAENVLDKDMSIVLVHNKFVLILVSLESVQSLERIVCFVHVIIPAIMPWLLAYHMI